MISLALFLSHEASGFKWWHVSLCLMETRDTGAAEATGNKDAGPGCHSMPGLPVMIPLLFLPPKDY